MKYNEDKLSDQQLVERVLRGDTEAFRSVIDRTQGLVTQIVFKWLPIRKTAVTLLKTFI